MLPLLIATSTASCANLLATEDAKRAAVCDPTKEVREIHAGSLVALGAVNDPRAATARRTGALALGAVAAGCGETGATP